MIITLLFGISSKGTQQQQCVASYIRHKANISSAVFMKRILHRRMPEIIYYALQQEEKDGETTNA